MNEERMGSNSGSGRVPDRRSGTDRRTRGRDREDRRSGADRRRPRGLWRWRDRRHIAAALLGTLPVLGAATPARGERDADTGGGHEPSEPDRANPSSALRGKTLWVDPSSSATRQAREWRGSRPEDAQLMARVAAQPQATWLGEWSGNVRDAARRLVRSAGSEVPVLVAYNIPNRDCNSYSAGGVGSAREYREWIGDLAEGVDGSGAVVVLEPDALAAVSCLTPEGQRERFTLIAEAVDRLKRAGAVVYIDAGHARWVEAEEMSRRLHLAGIARADGFSLNVSNFHPTQDNIRYGEAVSGRVGNKHFVIDTSRNGAGSQNGEWCNPQGAALGETPTTETGHPLADAFLWIKRPGESDGTCNGGPRAGAWWPEYALDLARRSSALG